MPFHKGHKINLGKKYSVERKRNMANGRRGIGHSEKTKKRLSILNKGKKLTEETKKKISISMKGKNTWSKGSTIPFERRKRIGEANKGEKSYLWKGGITPTNRIIRNSLEYKLWRKAVFERDNYICIWGGKEHGIKLQADHIKPFSLFPELRFAIDNGRTLCKSCHRTTDTWGYKIKKYGKMREELNNPIINI